MGKPVGGGDVARRQARQGRGVEVEHLSVCGDLLPVLIDEKDKFCIRVRAQARYRVLELLVLLFVHYDRSRHRFSSIIDRLPGVTRQKGLVARLKDRALEFTKLRFFY